MTVLRLILIQDGGSKPANVQIFIDFDFFDYLLLEML